MIKKLVASFLLFLPILFSHAQEKVSAIIWAKNVLTWDDYQEKDIIGNHALARTTSTIRLEISASTYETPKGMAVIVKVFALMLPAQSFVKKGEAKKEVLAHEQMHFDIAELWARKIRKEISETSFTTGDYRKRMYDVKERLYKESRKMQAQYDDQHLSKNKGHNWWVTYMQESLDALDAWKNPVFPVTITATAGGS